MSSIVRVCTIQLDRCRHRIEAFASALPADEQERARRYLRSEDQARYVVARTLTRQVCSTHMGTEPQTVIFRQSPSGKPYLPQGEPSLEGRLEFNVSHSGNCVLLAWTVCGPVGVDVEVMAPVRQTPFSELARTVFSPEECRVLASVKPSETEATFYRIWVRKEAVLKAEGCGVGGPMQAFSVATVTATGIHWPEIIAFPLSDCAWSVIDLPTSAGHAASVVVPLGAIIQDATREISPGLYG